MFVLNYRELGHSLLDDLWIFSCRTLLLSMDRDVEQGWNEVYHFAKAISLTLFHMLIWLLMGNTIFEEEFWNAESDLINLSFGAC